MQLKTKEVNISKIAKKKINFIEEGYKKLLLEAFITDNI